MEDNFPKAYKETIEILYVKTYKQSFFIVIGTFNKKDNISKHNNITIALIKYVTSI